MRTFIILLLLLGIPGLAGAIDYVNEGSSATLTLTFKNESGALTTPTSGTYSIYDLSSGTALRASTAFTPSSSTHSLTISSTENQMVSSSTTEEKRRVTVTWTYSGGKLGTAYFDYIVKNLTYYP